MCKGPIAAGKPSAQDNFATNVLGVNPNAKAGTPQSNGAGALPQDPLRITAVQVEIDNLALEPMRNLAQAEADDGYRKLFEAISDSRKEIEKLAAQAAKDEQMKFEIMIGLAVVVATPLTAGAAAAIAGSALAAPFQRTVARNMPEILRKAGINLQRSVDEAIAVQESIGRLANKFSGSDSQKILGELTKSLSKAMPVFAQKDRYNTGISYLTAMKSIVDGSKKELNKKIAAANFDELLSIYNAFESTPDDAYSKHVSKRIGDFMDQMADVMVNRAKAQAGEQTNKETMVKMNAYGRIRYARVLFNIDSNPIFFAENNYTFKAWVAPELEEMAEKMGPQMIDPKMIRGHLPAPPPDPPKPEEEKAIEIKPFKRPG
jgi:hypothetical protein